jgi:hypothetical protein
MGDDWDRHIQDWGQRPENQILTPEEVKNYNDLFRSGQPKEAETGKATAKQIINGVEYHQVDGKWRPVKSSTGTR